ncbi:cytochrome aa3 quinol oxidase subunit IV [Bacillus subtilis]
MANKSAEHSHFPWKHIVGFILSIVLTLLALWVAVYTDLSSSAKLWIIFGFAFIQAALQLLMFMHMTESENGTNPSRKHAVRILWRDRYRTWIHLDFCGSLSPW